MPPDRRTRTSTIVRVRWQRRTAAIPIGTVQAVIQQASDHFRLKDIIDELVLVAEIEGEELELTSNTVKLLAKDAVVVLRCIAGAESGRVAQKSTNATSPSLPMPRLARPSELPARPIKARSPSPNEGSCQCGVCLRAASTHRSAPESVAVGRVDVKSELVEDEMTISVTVPNRPPYTLTTRPSVTGQDIVAVIARKLNVNERDLVPFLVPGRRISLNHSLHANGVHNGGVLEIRFSRGGGNVSPPERVAVIRDGRYWSRRP